MVTSSIVLELNLWYCKIVTSVRIKVMFFSPVPLCDKHIMSAPVAHLSAVVPLYRAGVKRIDVSG